MSGYSWRFIVGMVLLLTNQIVGWGGAALFTYLGRKTGRKIYFAYGTAIYAFSWAMLAAGVFLVGPEGVKLARQLMKSYGLEALVALAAILAGVIVYVRFKKKKTGAGA